MSRVVVRLWHLLSWLELLDSLDDKSSTTSRTTTLDIDAIYYTTLLPSNIISLPLAFVRSGGIGLDGGKANYIGHDLYGWSDVSISASVTYVLGVNPTEVHPSKYGPRWSGFPLCCHPIQPIIKPLLFLVS